MIRYRSDLGLTSLTPLAKLTLAWSPRLLFDPGCPNRPPRPSDPRYPPSIARATNVMRGPSLISQHRTTLPHLPLPTPNPSLGHSVSGIQISQQQTSTIPSGSPCTMKDIAKYTKYPSRLVFSQVPPVLGINIKY